MSDRAALQPQFRTDKWTFLLDGRVVETFYEGATVTTRFHVDHLKIDGEQHGLDIKIKWGIEVVGMLTGGGKAKVAAADIPAFNAFVAEAISNRTPGYAVQK